MGKANKRQKGYISPMKAKAEPMHQKATQGQGRQAYDCQAPIWAQKEQKGRPYENDQAKEETSLTSPVCFWL